jgi:O-methyltransferase
MSVKSLALPPAPNVGGESPPDVYLDLLKRSLMDLPNEPDPKVQTVSLEGRDYPSRGLTMVGIKRLDQLQECAETVLRRGVPGDFIEAGAWKGGATIFLRGILKAYNVTDRTVWVSDSFEGLPPPDGKYPADAGSQWHLDRKMQVTLQAVQDNFRRYGLLDDQVKFLKGWFKDTLPTAPIQQLAVLRVDGDMYQSTMEALTALYPKVAKGGCVILDDHFAVPTAKQAADDYRSAHGIMTPIIQVDWAGAYWYVE